MHDACIRLWPCHRPNPPTAAGRLELRRPRSNGWCGPSGRFEPRPPGWPNACAAVPIAFP
eukprot:4899737-Prorocentrum_lima.AAC.1